MHDKTRSNHSIDKPFWEANGRLAAQGTLFFYGTQILIMMVVKALQWSQFSLVLTLKTLSVALVRKRTIPYR
jgi:hypothetical protein